MKSVVVDCRMINVSGIGTYIKNILPGIISSGHFQVTCMGYDELKEFDWFTKVKFIHLNSPILGIGEQRELPKAIPPCDIYWAPNWNVSFLKVKASKILVTIHDVYHLANKKQIPLLKYLLAKLMLGNAVRKADKVVTVSQFSKNEIIKYTGCKAKKISVSPLAVADDFNKNFTTQPTLKKYLLYVGNVKPHKNLINALIAFSKIKRQDVQFDIIGKKEGFITGYNNLYSLIQDLDEKVEFTGYVDDNALKNYYANATAFILPSTYEGFGLTLLEAMKFNIPIACSNAASLTEVGGDAVQYFDPHNVDDIVRTLDKVLDPAFNINPVQYAEQLSKFNWSRTISEHIDILLTL